MISQDLVLDASEAEQTIASIDQQLQQTAELFKVALADALDLLSQPIVPTIEPDTAPAIAEIDALSTEPVAVTVDAQTADAEQLILALDETPVEVAIGGNTAPALTSIDEVRQAADSAAIDIPVEADTTAASASIGDLGASASEASGGVGELDSSLAALTVGAGVAEGSAKELLSTFGEMGGEGAAVAAGGIAVLATSLGGFFQEGLNAVSAGQRFDFILGELADKARQVNVDGLDVSLADLGIQFGSTGADMENVTAKLVSFSVNSGASKEDALQFAQTIEALSARAIALNPQLGDLASVTDNLGLKIGRGGRFAAQYGLDLNGAEIASRALADTGKSTTSELTFVEKAMAGAEIASEKYGSTLAGTVAEGEKNAAIQAESLKATFKEAIEQIGVPIVAPVLNILREAEPDAVLIAQDLGMLGQDVLPVVAGALALIGPPLQLISDIFQAIPGPIITAATAFFVAEKAIAFLAAVPAVAGAAALGLNIFAGAEINAAEAGVALEAAVPELALLAAAAAFAFSAFGGGVDQIDKTTQEIQRAATGFEDLTKSVRDVLDEEIKAALQSADFAAALADSGVSATDLREALISGGNAFDFYAGQVLAAANANGVGFDGAVALSSQLNTLRDASEQEAKKALDSAVANGQLTQTRRDEIEATAGQVNGQTNYVAALAVVQPELDAATQKTKDLTDAQKKYQDSLDNIAATAPGVAASVADVKGAYADEGLALEGLAISLDKAQLSSADLDAVAQNLGVTTQQLKGFISDVTGQLDDFVKTAVGKLPDVTTAIDAALDPSKREKKPIIIDPVELGKQIDAAIKQIDDFNANIAFLTSVGLDNLAKVAAERGPEFTQAIVDSVNSGDNIGEALDTQFGELNTKTANESGLLRDAGTGIIVATGQVAADATAAFGDKFQIGPPTQAQLDQAKLLVEMTGIPLADALRAVAGNGAVAYEQAFGAIPTTTANTLSGANTEIDGWAHQVGSSSTTTGSAGATGFAEGLAPIVPTAETLLGNVHTAINFAQVPLMASAFIAGYQIGASFDGGIKAGIEDYIFGIEQAARDAIDKAEAAARNQSHAHSPSRLFMAVGRDMGLGIAAGLTGSQAEIERASRSLVNAALPDPGWRAGIGNDGGARGGVSIGLVNIVLDGSASSDPVLARTVGRAAGDAFVERLNPLAGRRLTVATRMSG